MSKPSVFARSRPDSAVFSVPCTILPSASKYAPSERGKNWYHAAKLDFGRSTRKRCGFDALRPSRSGLVSCRLAIASVVAAARRAVASSDLSATVFAASRSVFLSSAVSLESRAPAQRSSSCAPDSSAFSASSPTSTLICASCSQEAYVSSQPSTTMCHSPSCFLTSA